MEKEKEEEKEEKEEDEEEEQNEEEEEKDEDEEKEEEDAVNRFFPLFESNRLPNAGSRVGGESTAGGWEINRLEGGVGKQMGVGNR